jgi:hypothetical protein
MRPGKKVYLHCQNKTRRAVLSCVLQTWDFRVITDLPEGTDPEVALIVHDKDTREEVADLDRKHPDTRILILIKREQLLEFDDQTGALMLDDKLPMIDLREHIRTAAARKRGPRRFDPLASEEMRAYADSVTAG